MTLHRVKVREIHEESALLSALKGVRPKADEDTWEARMARRAASRGGDGVPVMLAADVPDEGFDDTEPRAWCSTCGLPDAPDREDKWAERPPCPRCGSTWRWTGRLGDLLGTATEPPARDDACCYEWRRFPGGQAHFGWSFWRTCSSRACTHAHHDGEVWLA